MSLADKTCVPCRGGVPPLAEAEILPLHNELGGDWVVIENHHLEKSYEFPDFAKALAFVNAVGAIAEEQDHHPEIQFGWGKVQVAIWTHKIDGLTESDFVFAARCDAALG